MPKILIVDDESLITTLLGRAFTAAGYEVRTAPNGPEAMRICKSESFDVVLSDIVMPTMDGHELARWVAANYTETRMVLMSGHDIGCEGCPYSPRCKMLAKPFLPKDAVAFVARTLGRAG
ncbi:MAG: response regulator [Acidobacteria bacterium]|nr:response regulator [Acidobacteriota bacterium]